MIATAEASEFRFGIKLGFAKAKRKIACSEKNGRDPGLGELPLNFGVSFNISAMADGGEMIIYMCVNAFQ